MAAIDRRPPASGVEWEFDAVNFGREVSRAFVTRLLIEKAEFEGWVLDRSRIAPDGRRSVILRRKIIRAARTA